MSNNSNSNNTYTRVSNQFVSGNVIHHTDDREIEWVSVYFKISRTEHTIYYNIPIYWSMTRFLKTIHMWIMTDFSHLNIDHPTCLIETGQDIYGVQPEDAHCLQPDEYMTYKDRFLANGKWPAFYVRVNEEAQLGGRVVLIF